MIQEPFFELPVVNAPTVPDTTIQEPIAHSLVATIDRNEEPVLQEPIEEPDAIGEGEQQQPQPEEVPNVEALRRSQRVRRSAIPDDYEVFNIE